MKILNNKMSLEDCLEKEWIITNGIGGFASSTIIGANTRKYHGLLIAPLTPPARRFLLLSKVDESIQINGMEHILYTNICKNYISDGYKKLESFEKEYVPKFTYKVKNTVIEKSIAMEYGKNTVCIYYHIHNGSYPAKFTMTPIVNYRDFHTMNTNHAYEIRQEIYKNKVKIVVDKQSQTPIYMNSSEGRYIQHQNDTFKNMFYIEEEKRGFFPEEDHAVVGRYEVELYPNEIKEISFVCSLEENIEEIDSNTVIKQEEKRLKKVIKNTDLLETKVKLTTSDRRKQKERNEFIKNLVIASDNFIVYRPSFRLHTVIAGYPWFLDWGRDSLISFEGLLLVTKRYDLAKEILLTFKRDIKYGLVPNGYSGYDNRPLYNSVDSSLLLFEQIYKYGYYTEDEEFIKKEFYDVLKRIIEAYQNGIDLDDNNIYMDKDRLIHSGTENTQNTWMDAKVEGFAVTPRNGKAVEINSMWYNALMIFAEYTKKFKGEEEAKKYLAMAETTKRAFNRKFYNKEKKCLYDVLEDDKIRPNQLFSLSLSYPVIDPNSKRADEIMDTVKKKLYTRHGLKTLAKGEPNYIEVYEGDGFRRDMSYHQGITWPWLLGLYYNAYKNRIHFATSNKRKIELEEECHQFIEETYKTFRKATELEGCLGSISELYDSKSPFLPKGAIAQAWSVAEVLRIILEK